MEPTNIKLLWTKSRNYLQMDGSNNVMDRGYKSFSSHQNLIKNMYCRSKNSFGENASNTIFNGGMMISHLLQLAPAKCGLLPLTHAKGIIN